VEKREPLLIAQNVLVQAGNLRTHPSVAAALSRGDLHIYPWIFQIETGDILAYDAGLHMFVSLTEQHPSPLPPAAHLPVSFPYAIPQPGNETGELMSGCSAGGGCPHA
jgi:carbonic anhydrase